MTARKTTMLGAALLCVAAAFLPAAAQGAAGPAWSLSLTPMPSNFAPGFDPEPQYLLLATNIGAAPTAGSVQIEATLPPGLVPSDTRAISTQPGAGAPDCDIEPVLRKVTCESTDPLGSSRLLLLQIVVEVSATPGTYVTEALVKGGGAAEVKTSMPTAVGDDPIPFGFLPGFTAPLSEEGGEPALLAGSHPYQLTTAFAFPTKDPGDGLTNDGHPRNITVELPRGLLGNPAASPVLCTEVQLTGMEGCPDESQVGLADVTTIVGGQGSSGISSTPLYNMVAPPGSVAEVATNVAKVGIFAHIFASVRSEDDYGISATTPDVIALGTQPIFSVQAQIWGDPGSAAHDEVRGDCVKALVPEQCPVTGSDQAFVTMPVECPNTRLHFEARADTWEEPSPQFEEHRTHYESADLTGNPVTVEDCEALKFEPQIQARPTTNLSDSPSGLDFTLRQPQDTLLGSRATAILKDAAIAFPAGLAVNPAQAAGLGACSEAQVGFTGTDPEGILHFSERPQSCPDAAKLGTIEATSPALVQRNEDHEVEVDPETGAPFLEPLHGSIYIASPFENPFGSLVAVYFVVEDKQTGIVAKLAGEAKLDPANGRITTYFKASPEVPIEDIKVHLFGGARGSLITPPACGRFTTTAALTPWSAPPGKDAGPADAFQTTATPLGGACPASEAGLPNAPKLVAGTLSPSAGKYSPLLFKLSRTDGTQRLGKIEATLPPGLSAKLAGVGICSEADIARARSREAPQKGVTEQADPSCPASSELGTATAAAGAGPTPYYTSGRVYLAGPYKGAPLSTVAIAPAVAGPFDLGAVVVRAALYLDPATAQGRVVSDPLPQVLHGVPVDLRSVAVRAERPDFTLNPTSCSEKSFGGIALSTLGAPASLFERFQVGGCGALPYKPKLSARLYGPINRGGHPRLRSVFTARAGDANTKAISFTFPKSEFIDQAHFRTICTRVQFAAKQCPAGSVYGHVKAYSPLLDYPVEGPVYLRSSVHKLPDVVLTLHGPPYQPLFFEAAGRVDSVKGGLRVRFQSVPDAPLSRVILTAQGGKKGLFQNSTNICKGTHRATLLLDAQNGKVHDTMPVVKAQCKGKGGKKGKGKGGKGR
jgi:hypothetical protein